MKVLLITKQSYALPIVRKKVFYCLIYKYFFDYFSQLILDINRVRMGGNTSETSQPPPPQPTWSRIQISEIEWRHMHSLRRQRFIRRSQLSHQTCLVCGKDHAPQIQCQIQWKKLKIERQIENKQIIEKQKLIATIQLNEQNEKAMKNDGNRLQYPSFQGQIQLPITQFHTNKRQNDSAIDDQPKRQQQIKIGQQRITNQEKNNQIKEDEQLHQNSQFLREQSQIYKGQQEQKLLLQQKQQNSSLNSSEIIDSTTDNGQVISPSEQTRQRQQLIQPRQQTIQVQSLGVIVAKSTLSAAIQILKICYSTQAIPSSALITFSTQILHKLIQKDIRFNSKDFWNALFRSGKAITRKIIRKNILSSKQKQESNSNLSQGLLQKEQIDSQQKNDQRYSQYLIEILMKSLISNGLLQKSIQTICKEFAGSNLITFGVGFAFDFVKKMIFNPNNDKSWKKIAKQAIIKNGKKSLISIAGGCIGGFIGFYVPFIGVPIGIKLGSKIGSFLAQRVLFK